MTNRHWLKQEVPRWVEEDIITQAEGKKILSLYKKTDFSVYKEAFLILAAVCLLAGLIFLGAGLWINMTQDQRFYLAFVPLLGSFLVLAAVFLLDKKIPDEPETKEEMPKEESEEEEKLPVYHPEGSAFLLSLRSGRPPQSISYHHRIPTCIRESAAVLHGLCLVGAFWMVGDSFKLTYDMYGQLAFLAFLFLVLTLLTGSSGMGILYMMASVGLYYTAPAAGWPHWMAWFFMILALPMLGRFLYERRDRAVICFSWVWAVGILLLIFWSAGDRLWQTLFFSLAAALTWMVGSAFRSYGLGAAALRFFGGVAVFAVLLEGSFGRVWVDIAGAWWLWILFILFLVLDAVLLFRMALKKEWLSVLAGFTPFVMGAAAVVAIVESSGALSATIISIYCAILALGIIARGVQMDRLGQRWAGVFILAACGFIRLVDSVMTYSQRGFFFLLVGIVAAAVCALLYQPSRKKKQKAVEEEAHHE